MPHSRTLTACGFFSKVAIICKVKRMIAVSRLSLSGNILFLGKTMFQRGSLPHRLSLLEYSQFALHKLSWASNTKFEESIDRRLILTSESSRVVSKTSALNSCRFCFLPTPTSSPDLELTVVAAHGQSWHQHC